MTCIREESIIKLLVLVHLEADCTSRSDQFSTMAARRLLDSDIELILESDNDGYSEDEGEETKQEEDQMHKMRRSS
jgi:hypothetical protein